MAEYRNYFIHQLHGAEPAIKLASEYRLVPQDWPATAMVPYLAYMPEQDRLAMLVIYGQPGILYKGDPGLSFSDEHGATWSVPRRIPGAGMTLTYLGNGTLFSDHMVSRDFGETWEALPAQPGREVWLPALVDRDPRTGRVTRLAKAFRSPLREWGRGKTGPYAQGYLAFSDDEGRSWQDEIKVPQWLRVSEIALARARNGDLVAACRLDLNQRLDPTAIDNYTGTGISISRDHGRTWDLDHRYILHVYAGNVAARDFWSFQGAPSSASTAVWPDGSLLTAFNMEHTKIGLVKWELNDRGLNKGQTHVKAAYDSALRNEFDPAGPSHR